jgi:acyl carrier protein
MKEKFLQIVSEALEKEIQNIQITDHFKEYEEWDSLAILSIMALIEENFGTTISRDNLNKCQTLEDLFKIVTTDNPQ